MKKIVFAIFAMVCFSILLVSCNSKPAPQTLIEQQVTVTTPQFFYLVESLVEKGNTVWGRAKIYLGDGNRWREIIAKNRFMQEPGRVWKDSASGTWYALIRPGEKLIIDNQEVNPTFVDIVDAPPVQYAQPVTTETHISDLGLILVIIGIALLLALFCFLLLHQRDNATTAIASTMVNIPRGGNIDDATFVDIIKRRQDFRDKTLDLAEKGIDKGTLKGVFVDESAQGYTFAARFRDGRPAMPVAPAANTATPAEKPADQKLS